MESIITKPKVAVIGASMAGLSVANVLQHRGAEVTVYEKFGSGFEKRGGGLGTDLSLLQEIRGSNKSPQSTGFYGHVWQYLYEGLSKNTVLFDQNIESIGDVNSPSINGKSYDLVLLCDGGFSALRKCITT